MLQINKAPIVAKMIIFFKSKAICHFELRKAFFLKYWLNLILHTFIGLTIGLKKCPSKDKAYLINLFHSKSVSILTSIPSILPRIRGYPRQQNFCNWFLAPVLWTLLLLAVSFLVKFSLAQQEFIRILRRSGRNWKRFVSSVSLQSHS